MPPELEAVVAEAEETRAKFRTLLDKTNKGNPHRQDVAALA